jgi:hypothetical protein
MYSGYTFDFEELNKSALFNDPEYFYLGSEVYQNDYDFIRKNLESDLLENLVLHQFVTEKNCFPKINADIFLAHSRADEKRAKIFTGFMKKHFNLHVFSDSCLRGYFHELIKSVDKKYCMKGPNSFSYDKSKYSSSHVHMILAASLMTMIDSIECIMFMDTPQTISIQEVVETSNSPWIYSELLMSQTMHRRKKESHISRISFSEKKTKNKSPKPKESVDIKYLLNALQLKDIHFADFQTVLQKRSDDIYPLDLFYETIPIDDAKYFYGEIQG